MRVVRLLLAERRQCTAQALSFFLCVGGAPETIADDAGLSARSSAGDSAPGGLAEVALEASFVSASSLDSSKEVTGRGSTTRSETQRKKPAVKYPVIDLSRGSSESVRSGDGPIVDERALQRHRTGLTKAGPTKSPLSTEKALQAPDLPSPAHESGSELRFGFATGRAPRGGAPRRGGELDRAEERSSTRARVRIDYSSGRKPD